MRSTSSVTISVFSQWDVFRPMSLSTVTGHDGVCYAAIWSPLIPRCFASVSGTNWYPLTPVLTQVYIWNGYPLALGL